MKKANLSTQTKLFEKKVVNFIWQGKTPKRVEVIVWFLGMGRLITRDMLARMNIITQEHSLFPLCGDTQETISHLFFKCRISWKIWCLCFQWWGLESVMLEKVKVNTLSWGSLVNGKFKRLMWNSFSSQSNDYLVHKKQDLI